MIAMDDDAGIPELLARRRLHVTFNYEFLIFMILAAFLSIFFVLYFNRVFGSIVSYAIRTYTWYRYRIYLDISALQVSLLAGRIFFTGLRYHGANETFLVQHGYITWRYWLRRVRTVDLQVSKKEGEEGAVTRENNALLPCRINVDLLGLEWFVYNRSPAYDSVLSGILKTDVSESRSSGLSDEKQEANVRLRKARPDSLENALASSQVDGALRTNSTEKNSTQFDGTHQARQAAVEAVNTNEKRFNEDEGIPLLLQLFPIHVDCQKAAAVIGNDNTKSVLIVKADSLSGDIDASETKTVDPYRQTFKIQFQHPVIEMKDNDDYKEPQAARATRENDAMKSKPPVSRATFFRRQRRKVMSSLRNMVPTWRRSVESFSSDLRSSPAAVSSHVPGFDRWQGLSRYIEDQYQDDKARWSAVEYAAESTILDSPEATLTVYWDIVARVTRAACRLRDMSLTSDINGNEAPAWGMHLAVKGGLMNYGPWADRQRADLQSVFFPTLSKDATPAMAPRPGDWRVPTEFDFRLELDESITLRVPIREESKNWRWRGKEPRMKHPREPNKRKQRSKSKKGSVGDAAPLRPSGWLEVKVPSNSTVTFIMDMLAGAHGYRTRLDLDFPSTELRSSVNHDLLWQSGPQRISCDLSNPLAWNSLRNWHFNVFCQSLKLYLLRDHIFLLIDLVDDWASSAPTEYLVFTPFKYHLHLDLPNLQLFFNINDNNIIDKATALEDNAFLILSTPVFKGETCIPMDKYRPNKNAIPFDVRVENWDLSAHSPQWNTQSAFLSSHDLGRAEALTATGSYEYNTTTSPANTDTLVLNMHGQSPSAALHGFIVRYFILLKDNYFGEHVHFMTLDEHQAHLNRKTLGPDADSDEKPPRKKSNDLDVIIGIKVDDPRIMLPTTIYSADRYVQCELASLAVDLRFTNYYMDMELTLSPLNLSSAVSEGELDTSSMSTSNTQLFVDGIRVFGHRLFGLPPTEPTYLCNWDVSVGSVLGECSVEFLALLARGGAAFGFNFDDVENALVPYSSIPFDDVTFARVSVESVRLWVHIDEAALLVSTDTISVKSNDWANSHYSKRADIEIPNIQVSCVNADDAAKQAARFQHPVDTDAYLHTSIKLASIGRKYHFSEARRLQQELVRREDQRTNRTQFLQMKEYLGEFIPEFVDPPAQDCPPPPEPLVENDFEGDSFYSTASSRKSRRLKKQSSFLSFSTSSNESVRRQRTPQYPRTQSKQIEDDTMRRGMTRKRPGLLGREFSGSTGSYSAFYSPMEDHQAREQETHSSVAFSSQYYAPHFTMESVRPDTREAAFHSTEEHQESKPEPGARLEDVNLNALSEDHAYSSLVIEFPSGITSFITPAAVRGAAALIGELQPSDPTDMLDSLEATTLTKIFDHQKQQMVKGEVKDISITLPKANLRLLNMSSLDSPDPSQEERDQYDFQVSNLALVSRTTHDWDGTVLNDSIEPRTSLQLTLGSAEMSASERLTTVEETQAAIMFQIEKVLVSLGSKEVTYFDADVGSAVGSTASGKIEYLASLIHRTGTVATELTNVLTDITSRYPKRLRFLTYRLLEEGHMTNDPSFLIRPSAVLRSAPHHLRTFDSWKMMIRLRQIWATLPAEKCAELRRTCQGAVITMPPDSADLAVAAFQRWRSWDLDSPRDSVLMRQIFGAAMKKATPEASQLPLLGACRLGEAFFVLDPGPKQSKAGLTELSARVEKKFASHGCGVPNLEDAPRMMTIVSVNCGGAGAYLKWEICELVDDILRLYNRNQLRIVPTAPPVKLTSAPKKKIGSGTHVVLNLARGVVEVETVNLRAKILSDGLKASGLVYDGNNFSQYHSLIMYSNAVTSKLHRGSRELGTFQLRYPAVFASHQLQETVDASLHTIKSTASSSGLSFTVKEDILGLLDTIDLVLRDEVAQLYKVKSQLPNSTTQKRSAAIAERLPRYRVNVAWFLDGYSITVPLLQSLTYKISGVVARASCAADFGREIVFDFDIKENSHEMQVSVQNKMRSISLLRIPPTNGRVVSQMNKSNHTITVLSSIEVIKLDASALYNLLSALNRPQISGAVDEIQQQVQAIQQHISDVFGDSPPPTPKESRVPSKPKSTLVYNVQLTLAGLQVFAQTSLKSELEPIAQVLFLLDKVYFQASNQHDAQAPISQYPEVHLNLRKIGLDIRRGDGDYTRSCGNLGVGITISAGSRPVEDGEDGQNNWFFNVESDDLEINLSPDTISTAVDVLGYLGEKIKDLDATQELEYFKKLRQPKPRITLNDTEQEADETDILDSVLASVLYHFELRNIRVCWIVADEADDHFNKQEDLVLSIKAIEFGTRTKKSARLSIADFLLQTVPPGQDKNMRSRHSALLPEVIFNVAYLSRPEARRMAFQAVGESLDVRVTPGFILPAANLVQSISDSMQSARTASAHWNAGKVPVKKPDEPPALESRGSIFGKRRLESLLIDADFAGAVCYISSNRSAADAVRVSKYVQPSLSGKYGQFNADDSGSGAVLRSPGLAWKVELRDNGGDDPALYGEFKIDASSNILYPPVVPLVMDMVSSVQEVVSETGNKDVAEEEEPEPETSQRTEKSGDEDNILTADPSAVLGRMKLNLGLHICRQEFTLSCQPIARVAATACFDSIYFTINTVASQDHGNFFAISGRFSKPHASVQHVYSRESTGSFAIDTMTLSLMNSKHVSGTNGVSAILKVSPTKVAVNAKQVQDFLLFREIWYPKGLRRANSVPVANLSTETSQAHLVHRYQQVAATAAFPWTATVSVEKLDVSVDLGQAIGKSVFEITDFWISSKKTSDWEQNLCLGFEKIGIDCTGRLSGFIALKDFKMRTAIQWPRREEALNETPLVQASLSFNSFRLKAAFDYQAFLVADITTLRFLMYNVRESHDGKADRLVAIFDGEAVQVFGTATSAAQGVALYQAILKLFQERKENFQTSLREIEKFMKRKSTSRPSHTPLPTPKLPEDDTMAKSPISLDTDVVVTLKALNLGVFPSTFSDHQVFKMEAMNAYARFAASVEDRRVHSILRMTLGQLRIGLAGVKNVEAPKTLNEISVDDVVRRATGSRGGTILKVPQVSAAMETWQKPNSNIIEFIFKSAFEGKVEVGWNYSRISYIRGMWANHSKSFEAVWGRELPLTAVKITGVPEAEITAQSERQKITAEVNVPVSRHTYIALEPPVIETPQLRDMGEATPPLEWIGLHRDRLPNLTHQIVIVALLELAGEVEDAYSRILGSS